MRWPYYQGGLKERFYCNTKELWKESSALKVRKHTTMEGFQEIATWDLKHRFAGDLNLLMSLTAIILEGRVL